MPRHPREIADIAVDDAGERDDRGFVGGDRIEVAHPCDTHLTGEIADRTRLHRLVWLSYAIVVAE